MSNQAGAQPTAAIIAFPARRPAPQGAPQGTPHGNQERLARALAGLDEALARQRSAMAEWRAALAELGASAVAVAAGRSSYHRRLRELQSCLATTHERAVTLERWADTMLDRSGLDRSGLDRSGATAHTGATRQ
jgi:hypothetical protein